MKKNKIAFVVFAVVMMTASFARAEGFGVDFDRGAFRSADFIEADLPPVIGPMLSC